jgi:hypothetical protein
LVVGWGDWKLASLTFIRPVQSSILTSARCDHKFRLGQATRLSSSKSCRTSLRLPPSSRGRGTMADKTTPRVGPVYFWSRNKYGFGFSILFESGSNRSRFANCHGAGAIRTGIRVNPLRTMTIKTAARLCACRIGGPAYHGLASEARSPKYRALPR